MRLEIGPGPERLGKDWTTVSAIPAPAVDYLCEWGIDPLPFEDESIDEIYTCHVIEHVGWMHVEAALLEAWRVLRPGAPIEIHTINLGALMHDWEAGKWREDWKAAGYDHPMQMLNYRAFSYAHVAGDRGCAQWHHGGFTRLYLMWLLERAGFDSIEVASEPRGDEKHGRYNLGVKAVRK